jgi:enterobacterial common antigen flippase
MPPLRSQRRDEGPSSGVGLHPLRCVAETSSESEVSSGESREPSYARIIKATTIISGGSLISILSGIARMKVMAVVLGPSGVGLIGLYTSIMNTASTIAGMGIARSGIRLVAQADATQTSEAIAASRRALKWTILVFGVLGTLSVILFRDRISMAIFGDREHATSILVLSGGVLATVLSGYPMTLLQGLRRIRDISLANILGSVVGTGLAVTIIYFLHAEGVAVVVTVGALSAYMVCTWLSRKLSWGQGTAVPELVWSKAREMVRLGVVFMLVALMTVATQLLVRAIINQKLGLEAAGYFQAAWGISMLYADFILQAMIVDYYPRLAAAANDSRETNALINEQTEVGLLLAAPLVLGMLTATPLLIMLFYASSFEASVVLLRWQLLGTLFKIAVWPIGIIISARGLGKLLLLTESSWNLLYLGCILIGIDRFGLDIAGIGFFASYGVYLVLIYAIARKISGFAWSRKNKIYLIGLMTCSVGIFGLSFYSEVITYSVGAILTGFWSSYCAWALYHSVGRERIERLLMKIRGK